VWPRPCRTQLDFRVKVAPQPGCRHWNRRTTAVPPDARVTLSSITPTMMGGLRGGAVLPMTGAAEAGAATAAPFLPLAAAGGVALPLGAALDAPLPSRARLPLAAPVVDRPEGAVARPLAEGLEVGGGVGGREGPLATGLDARCPDTETAPGDAAPAPVPWARFLPLPAPVGGDRVAAVPAGVGGAGAEAGTGAVVADKGPVAVIGVGPGDASAAKLGFSWRGHCGG
jgi:hypothetical protein